ncbi:MAG: hypothetical protein Q8P91_00220 [bacterium]|nr:hypothetical protein [bacterium]
MLEGRKYFLVAGSESLFPVDLTDVQEKFHRRIQTYYPNDQVRWVSLVEARKGLMQKLEEARRAFPNAVTVTFSSLYFPWADCEISANRIVDKERNNLGVGQRPKAKCLKKQVDEVMQKAGDRPIIILDDTLFKGHTIDYLVEEKGLRINAAVECFTFPMAIENCKQKGISVFSVEELQPEDCIDGMPLHDFLPPLPLCGKVLGLHNADDCEPLIDNDGASFSFPYLMPWISPQQVCDWASIPEEYVVDFSTFAILQSIEVMNRLKPLGYLTINDMVANKYSLRTSVPYLDGSNPDMNENISVMLRECLHLVE